MAIGRLLEGIYVYRGAQITTSIMHLGLPILIVLDEYYKFNLDCERHMSQVDSALK